MKYQNIARYQKLSNGCTRIRLYRPYTRGGRGGAREKVRGNIARAGAGGAVHIARMCVHTRVCDVNISRRARDRRLSAPGCVRRNRIFFAQSLSKTIRRS